MYIFHIVRAKYSPRLRNISGLSLFLLILLGSSFFYVLYAIPDKLRNITDNQYVLTILGIIILFLPIQLFFEINAKIIGKTYTIGTMEFTSQGLKILTKELNKEITFNDIRMIKFKVGTGNGGKGSQTIYDTYIASIILKDKEIFNIHLTKSWFKEGIEQKKFVWNKNVDLFDLLKKNKIRVEFDKRLIEADCLKN